jgi:predicted nuclease of predicted toxin-antitoxin system
MRFLADESFDFDVVRALRSAGHDVQAVAEISPRAADSDVVDLAVKENKLLLTEDKDFGRLVFADHRASGGVILLRFPAGARQEAPKAVVSVVATHGTKLNGCFTVVQPGRVRIRAHPPEE